MKTNTKLNATLCNHTVLASRNSRHYSGWLVTEPSVHAFALPAAVVGR